MVSLPSSQQYAVNVPRRQVREMHMGKILAATLLMALSMGGSEHTSASERAEQLARNALALEGKSQRGAQLFGSQCASCHGRAAHGNATQLVPALAGQRRAYLIKQLADFAESERVATQMHAVVVRSKVRDPQAWADVALHLNSLAPLTGRNGGIARQLALGEASYQQWCASCHEEDARGDDDGFVPALRNQHYEYLLQEMRALSTAHRFNLDAEIGRSLAGLEREELTAIAGYLSRLRGPVRDRARLQNDGTVSD